MHEAQTGHSIDNLLRSVFYTEVYIRLTPVAAYSSAITTSIPTGTVLLLSLSLLFVFNRYDWFAAVLMNY
jgi:hypothetical protein